MLYYEIEIEVITGKIYKFCGRYRRDLEAENWHYYEEKNGRLRHFRKEHIVAVTDDSLVLK